MKELLVREPITIGTDLNEDLAVKAEALLGYSHMRKSLDVAGPLGRILKQLEIEPFSADSVSAYKEAARVRASAENKRQFPGTMSSPEWKRVTLRGYPKPVPQHVLSRALDIFERSPAVVFWIEEIAGDPFLIADLDDEQFYIEVWDEQGFDQLRNDHASYLDSISGARG